MSEQNYKDETLITGLIYISEYINLEDEHGLMQRIDKNHWLSDLKRRVQHYGYRYDYKARRVKKDSYLGELPSWLSVLSQRLYDQGFCRVLADQVIINEYMPGQGIAPHIDCIPCFDESIISLSLNSTCVLEFIHEKTNETIHHFLEARSLVSMTKDARYHWKHGIRPRKTDLIQEQKIRRGRRISLTFRKVILAD